MGFLQKFERLDYQGRARYLVGRLLVVGIKKEALGDAASHVVRSLGTARAYQNCIANFLQFRDEGNAPSDGPFLRAEMDDFLRLSSLTWQQATLEQNRLALNKIFSVDLPRYQAAIPTVLSGRAYSPDEVERIIPHQRPRNAISTRLLYAAGLRAFEAARLCDVDVIERSNRPWRDDLFCGLTDIVICSCPGKGGLVRYAAVPKALYEELDKRRFPVPTEVRNRKHSYLATFDIGSGQALSQSFTAASTRALGFSLGIHGLRHSYIQRRLAQFEAMGIPRRTALEICSQEVGHFRHEITLTYTRERN
jgi:integrase